MGKKKKIKKLNRRVAQQYKLIWQLFNRTNDLEKSIQVDIDVLKRDSKHVRERLEKIERRYDE